MINVHTFLFIAHQCLYFLFIFFVIHQCSFCSPEICGRLLFGSPFDKYVPTPATISPWPWTNVIFAGGNGNFYKPSVASTGAKDPEWFVWKFVLPKLFVTPSKQHAKPGKMIWDIEACQNPAWQWIIYSSLWRDPYWSSRKSTVTVCRHQQG